MVISRRPKGVTEVSERQGPAIAMGTLHQLAVSIYMRMAGLSSPGEPWPKELQECALNDEGLG